jgi:hypothetical protein
MGGADEGPEEEDDGSRNGSTQIEQPLRPKRCGAEISRVQIIEQR